MPLRAAHKTKAPGFAGGYLLQSNFEYYLDRPHLLGTFQPYKMAWGEVDMSNKRYPAEFKIETDLGAHSGINTDEQQSGAARSGTQRWGHNARANFCGRWRYSDGLIAAGAYKLYVTRNVYLRGICVTKTSFAKGAGVYWIYERVYLGYSALGSKNQSKPVAEFVRYPFVIPALLSRRLNLSPGAQLPEDRQKIF